MTEKKEKTHGGTPPEGAVSLYLALMMAVMIPLLLTMVEGARISAIKLRLECAADLSMDAVMAEYNRELLRQYDLLLIDTAYDQGQGSLDHLISRLEDYLSYNLQPGKGQYLFADRDLLGLRLDSAELTKVSRATDEGGKVFRYLAISSMLEKYGLAYVADAEDMINTSVSGGLYDSDIQAECDDAQGAVDAIEVPEPEPEYDEEGNEIESDWDPPEKDDPAGNVHGVRSRGILSLVCKKAVSAAGFDAGAGVDQRSLVKGDGYPEDWDERNSFAEQLLFNEYILEKCGCYTEPKENSHLQYEIEYVTMGKDNDTDNLKAVANRLLLFRGGANTVHYFRDGMLQSEARGMAAALSFVCFMPECEGIFEALIAAAWIFAESLADVRSLMDGGRIPLIKEHEDWNLSLSHALSIGGSAEDDGGIGQKGLNYKEHLRLLLYLTPEQERLNRCMNVVELDVRKIPGYENFRLDDCVAGATMQLIFKSSYGYTFLMERRFRYV
ncbi:MAG: hypothetical protein IJ600_00035 [Lachnospiraceae bacterium]|nr:hypothetical protein [Lachnospiraceae bacterium]